MGEHEAWRVLLRASARLTEALDSSLGDDHGVSLADFEIMVLLSESPGRRLRMTELAAQAGVSKSRLTHRIDRLVTEGLVRREPCDNDRRGSFAVLTSAGRRRVGRAVATHRDAVRRYFVNPLTRKELEALASACTKIAVALETPAP